MPELIKIVGSDKDYRFADVKDQVIKLSDSYYWRDDRENIVRVKSGKTGKVKYYRKISPLIQQVKLNNGINTYVLKSEVTLLDDGLPVWSYDEGLVTVDGKLTKQTYCVNIEGKWYLKNDTSIVKCRHNGNHILKDKAIVLAEKFYGKNAYVAANIAQQLTSLPEGFVYTSDCITVINEEGVSSLKHGREVENLKLLKLVVGFQDHTNPQIGRYDYAFLIAQNLNKEQLDQICVRFIGDPREPLCHVKFLAELNKVYEDTILSREIKEADKWRKKMNASYGDAGPDENQAVKINPMFETWPGKHIIAQGKLEPVISASTVGTGGIGYSFGVEIETSAGVLGKTSVQKLDCLQVGDRSIGSAEYVTPVLHGDAGIEYLKTLCNALAKETMVDDRCSIHVHVGGFKKDPKVWQPVFNHLFAINAIRLGAMLEKEFYLMNPQARSPTLYHCHSIWRYRNINEENWRQMLGHFVFGPRENWNDTFRPELYNYGSDGQSKTTKLGNWCDGRYKWLNLVRAYSGCSSPTLEIRIFSGSTNFDKIYNFVLLSLAFMWNVENNMRGIMEGKMTLESMIKAAYADNTVIINRLTTFVAERKEKFKRELPKYPN